ncbi:MAG: GFA family protein [Alphaproteobacteria bacterium]|nr:GFA family protein [Alphaproteobacteria bacterium]
MIGGSCFCGAVRFALSAKPTMMGTCHCTRCRKAGASTIVFVKKADLKWIEGREHVQRYEPAPPYKYGRCFCRICGTLLGEILSEADSFPIAASALDGELDLRNEFHEFVSEKPSWYEICDEAKQFDGHPVST